MVITDRLTKGVILEDMDDISTDAVARKLIKCFYPYHGLPAAITSDRGPQFVSALWKRFCELLQIEQRLSTGYHPQTDGSTERMNQEVEKMLRIFVTYSQGDWAELLPMVIAAINNRDSSSIGMSPFFFTHGYHIDPISLDETPAAPPSSGRGLAEAFVARMQEATEWAQAAMAAAQDRQEVSANRSRQPAPRYKPGDYVWLNLKNVKTTRPSKKLDWIHAKYRVVKEVNSHSYELDTPGGIHPVFHVDLLRPAGEDPLPSQESDDTQPPPILIDGEEGYLVESILCAAWHVKPGGARVREVLTKWKGWAVPTWEPLSEFEGTDALEAFERTYGNARKNDGPKELFQKPRRQQTKPAAKRAKSKKTKQA